MFTKKVLVPILSALTIGSSVLPAFTAFATNTETVSNSSSTSTNADANTLIGFDTNTNQRYTITYSNHSQTEGTITLGDESHTFVKTFKNWILTVYIDGSEVMTVDVRDAQISPNEVAYKTISNGKVSFKHSGRNYYYVNTTKTRTAEIDKTNSDLLYLLNFVPYVGSPLSIVGGIKGLLTKAGKNRWYTIKMYCTKNYKYYAFKTYTYSNSKRTKLVGSKTTYKTMF